MSALWLLCGLWLVSNSADAIRLLKCQSVNQVPVKGAEYVFISMRKDDCTFVFEGPVGSRLEMDVRNLQFPKQSPQIDGCKKSRLAVYNYVDSRIILGKLLCNDNDKANVLTKVNMGLITATLPEGSFSLRIRPVLQNSDVKLQNDVDGILPPESEAMDFFFFDHHRADEIDEGFKPLVSSPIKDFRPSVPEPSTAPLFDSYHNQGYPHYYPGRPSPLVDLTNNSTGSNSSLNNEGPGSPSAEATTPRPTPAKIQETATTIELEAASSETPPNATISTVSGSAETTIQTKPSNDTVETTKTPNKED